MRCALRPACIAVGTSGVPDCPLEGLARPSRCLARAERLFSAGDELDSVYLVRDGALKTVTLARDGEEQVLAFHLPGEMVGLDAMATGRHRCDAVALGETEVCELSFPALQARAAQRPLLQAQLYRAIGQRANRDQEHVEMLIRRQASDRIALFLHGIAERTRPVGEAASHLTLPMSREDIARFLGLALETVSRGFTRLQDDGVIGVAGRHIDIRAPHELQRLARQA
jgi:CRP/FNR family transcriptional regulator